jgi:hypothetical protein
MRLAKGAYALCDQGVNSIRRRPGSSRLWTLLTPITLIEPSSSAQKLARERKYMQPRRMRRSLRHPPGVHSALFGLYFSSGCE